MLGVRALLAAQTKALVKADRVARGLPLQPPRAAAFRPCADGVEESSAVPAPALFGQDEQVVQSNGTPAGTEMLSAILRPGVADERPVDLRDDKAVLLRPRH